MTEEYTNQRIKVSDRNRLLDLAAHSAPKSTPPEIITAALDFYASRLVRLPAIEFTGKGDEIGKAFQKDGEQ